MNDLRFASGEFCSFGSAANLVELPTNLIVLGDVQVHKHFEHIFSGTLPAALLSDVLHEFTHHWCFFSPLGTTLTGLYLKIQQLVISRSTVGDLYDAVIRYETTMAALRPIAEGLALFGEFDAAPGPFNCRAPVMMWLLTFFDRDALRPGTSGRDIDVRLTDLLADMRRSDDLARKKESLLTSPLGLHRGGYLAGYLGVRNVWNRCLQHVPDAELMWAYLRSFFFDDRAFLDVILNNDIDIFEVHTSIIEYVRQRLALLASADLLPSLAQYHDDVSRRRVSDGLREVIDVESMPAGLLVDPHLAFSGAGRARALMDDVLRSSESPEDNLRLVARVARLQLARRNLLCIASAAGGVRVNERKRVIFTSPEGFTYGAPAMPQAAVEEGTGALEFYFSPTGIFFVEVITLEHRPVALTITGGRPGSERERGQIEDYVLNRSAVLAREQRVHQLVEALINKQEAAEYLVLLRQDVGQRLDAIYGDWCMTGIGQPGSGATLRARMHDRGFWDPLEEDLNLVRATAITSVRTAASDSEPAIGNVLSRLDVTPAELRRRLRSVERDTGLRLLDPLTDRIAV